MKALVILLAQLAATGSDAYFTQRNFGRSFRERDPLVRPFVRNTPDLVLSGVAYTGLKIYLPHTLRLHGHSTIAGAVELSGIALNAAGSIESSRGHHR